MRRRGALRVRPEPHPHRVVAMKSLRRHAETSGIAADLIQREQPVINVKDGVLEAFRHERPGHLLEAHDEMNPPAALLGAELRPGFENEK